MYLQRSLNLKLPKWADDDFLRRLDEFYDDSFKYLVHTEKMKKLLAGEIFCQVFILISMR